MSAFTAGGSVNFFVIVLGVLAALAVDSWSEERRNRVLEQVYLARITEDLNRDVSELEETIDASILQARSATTLLLRHTVRVESAEESSRKLLTLMDSYKHE
jgi:hypothetical protein